MQKLSKTFLSIRTWLTENKIFFDVFQNILLGFMALLISLYSLKISKEEHTLNKLKSLPALKIAMNPIKTTTIDFYDTYNLEIDNDGERLSNFRCNIYTFLRVERDCGRCPTDTTFQFQVNDWYSGINYTNNHTGKLLESIGSGNNLRLYRLRVEGRDIKLNSETFNIDLITFLKINYKDIEDINHTEYWEIDHLTSNQISEAQFISKVHTLKDSLDSFHPSLFDLNFNDIRNWTYRTEGVLTSK